MMSRLRSRLMLPFALACALSACAADQQASSLQREAAAARLLSAFKPGVEVGCAELEIAITPNFHGNVGQPAPDASFHTTSRDQGDGFRDTVWTNRTGDPAHGFRITVGKTAELTERGLVQAPQTTFLVVNQVRLRVYEDRRPPQLDVAATGAFVFVRDAGGKPREVKQFVVVDGVLRGQ